MKLVNNWKEFWKWYSIRIFGVIALFPVVWSSLPPDVKSLMPTSWGPWILTTIAVCGIIGRIVDQGTKDTNG